MNYLILVRHGESRWNLTNKFCGWVDVPLSENGIEEAKMCGDQLENLELDVAFTSNLERSHATLLIILAQQYFTGYFVHKEDKEFQSWYLPKDINKEDIPIHATAKLNERHYGDLQGLNKEAMRKKYGEETVFKWRRSFENGPPRGESLKQAYQRIIPYFRRNIMKEVKLKKNVLIAAHGNSLRCIIKYIEKIDNKNIPHLELPTGKPIIYKYSRNKLIRQSDNLTFDRPLQWGNSK